jgi:EmrB/QacA subfamily drug resistance transporter
LIKVSDQLYKWLIVATVGAGILTSTLDGSIVNIAYPILADVFNIKASTVLWVTVSYLIVSAAIALPLGSVGDLIGRKRLFVGGFLIFTIGLGLVTASQTIGQLIGFRIFQGIGQGMMLAISNALIVSAFPDHERGRALGINGAMVGIGLASGPVIGGFILEFLDWRALFWTRLPVGIVGLLMALIVLRPDTPQEERRPFDYKGAILLMLGLSSLLLLINRAPIDGISPLIIVLFISTVTNLSLFFFVEQRIDLPIFDFRLLKQRIFAMAVTSSMLHFIAQAAFLFLMPFYLLQGLGLRPIEAGPILMTLQITRLICSPLSGFLSDRFQSRTISTLGLIVMAIGYVVLLNLDSDSSTPNIVIGLFLAGCGSATFLPPNNNVIMGSVGRERLGMVSAIIPVVRQVGLSLGITIVGTIYTIRETFHYDRLVPLVNDPILLSEQAVIGGYFDGFVVALLFVLTAIVISAARGKRPLPRDAFKTNNIVS